MNYLGSRASSLGCKSLALSQHVAVVSAPRMESPCVDLPDPRPALSSAARAPARARCGTARAKAIAQAARRSRPSRSPTGSRSRSCSIDTAPVVAVQVWYHAGSKDEPRDRRGSAHMFEHMMFKGTEHVRAEAHAQFAQRRRRLRQRRRPTRTRPTTSTRCRRTTSTSRSSSRPSGCAISCSARTMIDDRARGREGGDPAAGELAGREGLPALPRRRVHEAPVRVDRRRQHQGPRRDDAGRSQEVLRRVLPAEQRDAGRRRQGDARAGQGLGREVVRPDREGGRAAAPGRRPRRSRRRPRKRREVVEPGQIGLTLDRLAHPAGDATRTSTRCRSRRSSSAPASRRGSSVRLKTTDPKTKQPLALDGGMEAIVREDPGMVDRARRVPRSGAGRRRSRPRSSTRSASSARRARPPTSCARPRTRSSPGFVFSLEHAQGLAEAIGRSWILTGDPSSFMHDVDEIEKVTAADVQRVVKQYLAPDKATSS